MKGGKRSATRVVEMMIPKRMDWRELHAIVGGRRIERDPLPFVLVKSRGRGVRCVRPLVLLPREGGGVCVDRVCGGHEVRTGEGSSVHGSEKLDRCRERPAEGRSTRSTHFNEETGGAREGSVDFGVRYL